MYSSFYLRKGERIWIPRTHIYLLVFKTKHKLERKNKQPMKSSYIQKKEKEWRQQRWKPNLGAESSLCPEHPGCRHYLPINHSVAISVMREKERPYLHDFYYRNCYNYSILLSVCYCRQSVRAPAATAGWAQVAGWAVRLATSEGWATWGAVLGSRGVLQTLTCGPMYLIGRQADSCSISRLPAGRSCSPTTTSPDTIDSQGVPRVSPTGLDSTGGEVLTLITTRG